MSDNDTTQGFIDETDVEGHRSLSKDDGARQRDEAGPEGARHTRMLDDKFGISDKNSYNCSNGSGCMKCCGINPRQQSCSNPLHDGF